MDGLRSPIRMVLEGIEGIVLLVVAVLTWPLARFFVRDLGTRPDERERDWPGDRLIERIDAHATRALTVRAPVERVWPWVVQFGLGRGGFHSYEMLERMGGIDVRNVERIMPELQTLAVGDELRLHPTAPVLHVVLLAPEEHLCTRTWDDECDLAERDPDQLGTFSFYLVEESRRSCRLVVRTCKQHRRCRGRGGRFVATFFEDPLDLVMEWRMLRTIRRLAERDAA